MGKGEGKGADSKGFDEATLETYKECFKLMDIDKDGVINKTDLRAAFDNMIKMFEAKMAGGVNDPDELVVNAFKAFHMEVEEKIKGQMVTRHVIDREEFTHILMNFGEKMTQDEIDDIYGEFDFDDNKDIFTKSVVDLFVAGAMDEKKEEKEVKREQLRRRRRRRPPSKFFPGEGNSYLHLYS